MNFWRPRLPRPAALLALSLLLGVAGGCTTEKRFTDPTLWVGDPAPPLKVSEWVRGQPVTRFEPDRLYLIEFWATWCQPCMASMQGTSRLQAKYPEILVVIALTVEDDDNSYAKIAQVSKAKAASMQFRVAIDDGTTTTRRYRRAAHEPALPSAFLIDASGRIAWIGAPRDAEAVVAKIVDGRWDAEAAARERRELISLRQRGEGLLDDLTAADAHGDLAGKLKALEAMTELPPAGLAVAPAHRPAVMEVETLAALQRTQEARAVAIRWSKEWRGARKPDALAELALATATWDPALAEQMCQWAEAVVADERARRAQRPAEDDQEAFDRTIAEANEEEATEVIAKVRSPAAP